MNNKKLKKKYNNKETGLVRTPYNIVELIIEHIWIDSNNILKSKILEPSLWDWNFFIVLLEKMIEEKNNIWLGDNDFLELLNDNLYAWELDKHLLEEWKSNLNKVLNKNSLKSIEWKNFKSVNSIIEWNKDVYQNYFDFVIWNPPYIRIQNISEDERKVIKENSFLCNEGSFDIYIPFFEFWYKILKEWWRLWYITPNTFLKTKTAMGLRKFLLKRTNIETFIDFKEHQVFSATTYSLITILSKRNVKNNNINLLFSDDKLNIENVWKLDLTIQDVNNWLLLRDSDVKYILQKENEWIKLWEICKISTWLATLADDIFIHKVYNFNNNWKYIEIKDKLGNSYKVEKDLFKPIFKASKLKSESDIQNLYILFPYEKVDWKNTIISETDIARRCPNLYMYLLDCKERLLMRDKWKKNKVAWYAFWRSQWIDSSFWKKIITSTMNKSPNFIYVNNEETTFFAWYSLVLNKKYDNVIDIEKLIKELNSENFNKYIQLTSRDYKGWYKSYSKSFMENYCIDIEKIKKED